MQTITIHVDEAVYARLAEHAAAQALDVGEYVSGLLAAAELEADEVEQAKAAARAHVARYPSLFQRLAE